VVIVTEGSGSISVGPKKEALTKGLVFYKCYSRAQDGVVAFKAFCELNQVDEGTVYWKFLAIVTWLHAFWGGNGLENINTKQKFYGMKTYKAQNKAAVCCLL